MSESPCDSVPSAHDTLRKAGNWDDCDLIKKAVVVLTRLPEYKISALRPPTPPQFYSEDESLSSSDSDIEWESEEDSSDSDFLTLSNKQKTLKSAKCETTTPSLCTSNNSNGKPSRTTIFLNFIIIFSISLWDK